MSKVVSKPKKPTKAEILERERAERQAYFREIEQRMSFSLSALHELVVANRPKKKSPSAGGK